MESIGSIGNALAHGLQKLRLSEKSDAHVKTNGIASSELAATTVLDENEERASQPEPTGSKADSSPQNMVNGAGLTGKEGSQPKPDDGPEANMSAPEIRVNGDAGEGFVNKDILGPEDDEDGDEQPISTRNDDVVGEAKKKKKKKSKSKRGLAAPSGFEEYYVDSPLTPTEHEEERGLYHSSIAFRERIETAIQRYFAKRNLNSDRKNVFDSYMSFGGVNAGPKMFSGGLDAKTLSDNTAAEIATLTAKHSVSDDKGDDSAYVVDFEGVAKAFLSSQLPIHFDIHDQATVTFHVNVIRNFLNYLLHHDVCPEYNSQIYAARTICDKADTELWLILQAGRLLPGPFNTACSEIFGGALQGFYVGDQDWAKGTVTGNIGISPSMARKVFRLGLIARASEESIKAFKKQDEANEVKLMGQVETGLEVIEILPAEEEVLELYQSPEGEGLKPVGRMIAKTWIYPGAPEEDFTEEEEKAAAAQGIKEAKEYELWLEDEVLQKCFVGMKFITVVKELSFGVRYFDALLGLYCSFYDVLPNEEMIGWREPEKEWLPMREKVDPDEINEDEEGEKAEMEAESCAPDHVKGSGDLEGQPNGQAITA